MEDPAPSRKPKKIETKVEGDLLDLNDILGGGDSNSTPASEPATTTSAPQGGDILDLLGENLAQSMVQPQTQAQMNPFGGGSTTQPAQTDMFGAPVNTNPVAQPPQLDPFGGNLGQSDMFGSMQSAPSFPSFIAFEDGVVQVGFRTLRDPSQPNAYTLTAQFKNKTGQVINNANVQAAGQKYMQLKLQPAVNSVLQPFAQDLTQEIKIINNAEGQKPLSLKLKINYQVEQQPPLSQIKIINELPIDA
mmetsp:Transcript_16317/g.27581  ORF Transcript_16317/g.27581 Transcript_16317/m.27581 type:complete len:247 (-) Transcript_16317:116-856(-)